MSSQKEVGINSIKINESIIIRFLLLLLPFIDMFNGYLIRQHNIRGIGSIYHLGLVFLLFCLWISSGEIDISFFVKATVIFVVGASLSVIMSFVCGISFTSMGIERESKIICTLLFVCFFDSFLRKGIITKEAFQKILIIQIWIIGCGVLLCDLSGYYNAAYTDGHGRMGLYSNMNELSIILATSLFFIFSLLYLSFDKKRFVLVIILLVDLFLVQSKFALGCIGVFFISAFFIVSNKMIKKRKAKSVVFIIVVGTVIVSCGLLYYFREQISDLLNAVSSRLDFLKNIYGVEAKPIDYLSSGRTTRFDELLLNPIKEKTGYNTLEGICSILFGFGFTGDMIYTFEMDPFDILLFNGLVGMIIYISICVHIFKIVRKHNKLINYLYVCILMVASILVGHVWLGGVCGVYFAMFCTYAINNMKSSQSLLAFKH